MYWSLENCKYDYFFKTDDDVFINIPNLLNMIYHDPFSKAHKDTLYAGYLRYGAPIRDTDSKWRVSEKEWAADLYAPFNAGGGYLLSYNVVKAIRPFFDWENPFKLEDVYVGHLVFFARIPNLGYRKQKHKEIMLYNDPTYCRYEKIAFVHHPVRSEDCMRKLTEHSLQGN